MSRWSSSERRNYRNHQLKVHSNKFEKQKQLKAAGNSQTDCSKYPPPLPFWTNKANYATRSAFKFVLSCLNVILEHSLIKQFLKSCSEFLVTSAEGMCCPGLCLLGREGFVTELLWGKTVIEKTCGTRGPYRIYKERKSSQKHSWSALSPSNGLILCCFFSLCVS